MKAHAAAHPPKVSGRIGESAGFSPDTQQPLATARGAGVNAREFLNNYPLERKLNELRLCVLFTRGPMFRSRHR